MVSVNAPPISTSKHKRIANRLEEERLKRKIHSACKRQAKRVNTIKGLRCIVAQCMVQNGKEIDYIIMQKVRCKPFMTLWLD